VATRRQYDRRADHHYPNDASLRERERIIAQLAERLRHANVPFAQALLALREDLPSFVIPHWQRRVAQALDDHSIDGEYAGAYWLEAGDAKRAETSLRARVSSAPNDAFAHVHLANALCVLGRVTEARIIYRDIFAVVPSLALFAYVKDAAFIELAHRAHEDFDVDGDATDWLAAIGLVLGVFQTPAAMPVSELDPVVMSSLRPGLRAYRLVIAERHARSDAERVAWRRRLKNESPALLKSLLSQGRRDHP
jgi:tetratricopeptide (TPR) repeat protein